MRAWIARWRRAAPSDMTVEGTLTRHPEMLSLVLPDLKSADPMLLRGAVTGVSRWIYAHPAQAAVEAEFLAAAEHVIHVADEQTVTNYAAALGSVRDPRAGTLLWDFVARGVARGQSLIAICWRKDPARSSAAGKGAGSAGHRRPE